MSKKQLPAARAFTVLHEAAERGATASPHSLHISPDVLVKDMNLLHNLTGPGAKGLATPIKALRAPEFEHLQHQVTGTLGPRAAEFMQPGQKMNRSMRKAFMRGMEQHPVPLTPEDAHGIMGKQQKVMMEDAMAKARSRGSVVSGVFE